MKINERTHETLVSEGGAAISSCERYRYRLWREWDRSLPTLCYLMLNPSTADERHDDATITRCQSRAAALKFGRIEIVNLYPLRATDPDELLRDEDPLGPREHADKAIADAIVRASMVICAWGNHKGIGARAAQVVQLIRASGQAHKMHCLGTNVDGSPKHPLYIAKSAIPQPFEP